MLGEGGTQRCVQCWKMRPLDDFMGRRGAPVKRCTGCQTRYGSWGSLTIEQRFQARRGPNERAGMGETVAFVRESFNRKLGPIPVSTTDMASCPDACSFRGSGCYAEQGPQRYHWQNVTRGRGVPWDTFLGFVRELPAGTLWRHNDAGDLPGLGDALDIARLRSLVAANRGRRGFTFTHKPLPWLVERLAIAGANDAGFTINLSADSLEHADRLVELGIAPVAVVVPVDAPRRQRTPAGRHVIVCPAQEATAREVSCMTCRLCALPQRKAIIAFRAHGQSKALVSQLVRPKRIGEEETTMIDSTGRTNNGAWKRGSDHVDAKLSDAACAEIRAARKAGTLLRVIAEKHGVAVSTISRVCNGRSRSVETVASTP